LRIGTRVCVFPLQPGACMLAVAALTNSDGSAGARALPIE
jgi:hypothetical protein